MISSVYGGASAMRAFETGTAVTANNVANVASDNFKASRADMNEGSDGGVRVTLSQNGTPGPMVSRSDGAMQEMSNTDLSTEFTNVIRFEAGYDANVKAVQTADAMKGTMINMVA